MLFTNNISVAVKKEYFDLVMKTNLRPQPPFISEINNSCINKHVSIYWQMHNWRMLP